MTSTDLLVIPHTGEQLDLTADDSQLAEWVDSLREATRQVREIQDLISAELLARMDKRAKWTLHAGALKVTAPSPAPTVEYDVELLRATLSALLGEGVIDEDAMDAALEVSVTYKPKVAGLNALKKLGSDVAVRIEACGREVEKPRRVSVKRA